jgi:AcrR family transcriptional regulator
MHQCKNTNMTARTLTSLRDRKKAETWTSIHEAAARLVLEQGIEAATVEAIAEAAGISPRTFFNYFPSKDDAVLGMRVPVLDPALLEGFDPEHDLLDQVSHLLLAVARSAYDRGDPERRRQLMQQYPHLRQRRQDHAVESEALVRQALTGLLAGAPGWSSGIGGHDLDEVARMLVMIAGVPLRFAITSSGHSPTAGLDPEDLASSVALLHEIRRKLS